MPPTRAVLEDMLSHQVARQRRFARQMLRQLDHEGHLPHSVPYPTVVWRLGRDLSIVGLSGEVCVDYALRLKRELGHKQTWVAGYTNEVSCYIPSERVLKEGGYEAGWRAEYGRAVAAPSMAIYGWPTPFAPGLEQKIVSTVHDLIAEP